MMRKQWAHSVVVLMLAVLTIVIWHAVFAAEQSEALTVSFLDVGQGDAVLTIESQKQRLKTYCVQTVLTV